jgi:heterotetrameric sarcosine oxidase beta subunit
MAVLRSRKRADAGAIEFALACTRNTGTRLEPHQICANTPLSPSPARQSAATRAGPRNGRSPEPRKDYDVIIVGAGGHGLGTAYYLAKEHGITNIAVIEKGWLGGGNTGRNTTIIRSNYLYDESAGLYDHALKLWDGLSQDLNYNVMYSARGVMMLAHNVHDVQVFKRHIHANRLNGIDNEWLTPEQAKEFCPPLNISSRRGIPWWVLRCNAAAAPPAMMRWPGAMRRGGRHGRPYHSEL